jgi:hypothetical protein
MFTRLFTAFYPPFMDKFGHLLHPCPYLPVNMDGNRKKLYPRLLFHLQGRIEIKNETIDAINLPDIIVTGDGKSVIRLTDERDKVFLEIIALLEVKGRVMG